MRIKQPIALSAAVIAISVMVSEVNAMNAAPPNQAMKLVVKSGLNKAIVEQTTAVLYAFKSQQAVGSVITCVEHDIICVAASTSLPDRRLQGKEVCAVSAQTQLAFVGNAYFNKTSILDDEAFITRHGLKERDAAPAPNKLGVARTAFC